tara:strand:- start:8714 stop:10204 length:1491 start_codon:yes stop_codon:yes gene_type:complete
MLNKKLLALSITAMLSASAMSQTNHFDIDYADPQGFGVNDTEQFMSPTGETTIGEYRKGLIELATRAVSLQFNFTTQHHLIIDFTAPNGYAALTSGPIFSEVLDGSVTDSFGVMELGRTYPSTLVSALTEVEYIYGEDAKVSFSDKQTSLEANDDEKYPGIVYDAYHEMMHVLGFVTTDCLGTCIPEPVSRDSHVSSFIYYNDAGVIKEFESLSLSQKTDAYLSTDGLRFGGSQASRDAAVNELTSGHQDGYVYMHSTPNENGDVDSQSGGHFSFDVSPAQLMYSSRAATEDIGMAAYLLCDVGWCRGQGKVIEQSVTASVNENASDENEMVIDMSISENINVGVDEFEFTFTTDPDVELISFEDTAELCSSIGGGSYRCNGELGALSTVELRLIVTNSEAYTLKGELKSTGFDVDRNGFNNILDAHFENKQVDVEDSTDGESTDDDSTSDDPTPTTPIVSAPQPQSGGGGSMSYILLPMLLLAVLRRRAGMGISA